LAILVFEGASMVCAVHIDKSDFPVFCKNRALIGNFVEVYCKCSIEELTKRDVKGLYKKALAGEIEHFTGISDPYEAPENPEVTIDSEKETIEESGAIIMAKLEELGYILAAEKKNEDAAECCLSKL